ncbi:MAG: hypothetical protein V4543_08635 [Bacteroidota bacterium]
MLNITLDAVRSAYDNLNYRWHPVFNLFGIRTLNGEPDAFDDFIGCAYNDPETPGTEFSLSAYHATTDPGIAFLNHPDNPNGTAVLKCGQYTDSHKPGFHRGNKAHPALIQAAPLTVWRDRNRDNKPDIGGRIQTGMFGLNIHRANLVLPAEHIGLWSAGCQVFRKAASLAKVLAMARLTGLSRFTYTLLNESDIIKA